MIVGLIFLLLAIPLLLLFWPLGLAFAAIGVLLMALKLMRTGASAATGTAKFAYRAATTKTCPDCKSRIPADAAVCAHCSHRFEAPLWDAATAPAPLAPADADERSLLAPPTDPGPSHTATPGTSPDRHTLADFNAVLQTTARAVTGRVGAMPARNRYTLVAGALLVPIVFVAAVWLAGVVGSPDAQLRSAIAAIARREATPVVADVRELAAQLGISNAPAGITFAVSNWQLSGPGGGPFRATWDLIAGGNGRTAVDQQQVTFTLRGGVFTWANVNAQIDVSDLVATVPDMAAAERLAADSSSANAAFAVAARLSEKTVADPSRVQSEPIRTEDPEQLAGSPARVVKAGTPPTVGQTVLSVGDRQYVIFGVPQPGEPGEEIVGTLAATTLTEPAAAILDQFARAKRQLDVPSVSALLIDGSQMGLRASGLAVSSLQSFTAAELAVRGARGAYYVVAPDGTELRQYDGSWLIDYSGQPIAVLAPCTSTAFTPAAEYSTSGGNVDPDWSIVFDGNLVVIEAGSDDPTLALDLSSSGEWYPLWWWVGTVDEIRIDNRVWARDRLPDLRHRIDDDLVPWSLDLREIAGALQDASEVELKYSIETGDGTWRKNMTQTWSTSLSCQT